MYKSGTHANKLINCYSPVFPSQPPAPSHLRLKLSQPLSTNVRFSFEKRKQTPAKLAVFPLTFISRLPLWDPYLLFFVVIARETMMLDRFRRGKNKQTTIKLYLRFVSPTLLARGRDPLSLRRFRRKKYSMSTRMEYVQTKLMNRYSPVPPPPKYPRPFQSPFDCCILPLSIPVLLHIKRFLLVLY